MGSPTIKPPPGFELENPPAPPAGFNLMPQPPAGFQVQKTVFDSGLGGSTAAFRAPKPNLSVGPAAIYGKLQEKLAPLFRESPEKSIATAANIYAISKVHKIPIQEVQKNIKKLMSDPKISGLQPGNLSNEEYTALVMTPLLGAAAIAAPVTTALSVAGFAALDKIVKLDHFLPEDANDPTRTAVELLDMGLKGGIVGMGVKAGAKNLSPFIEKYFQTKMTQYNLPEKFTLSRDQVADIFKTGKLTTAEQQSVFAGLGLSRAQLLSAVRKGVNIEVPGAKIIQMVDKPGWAAFKKALNIKGAAQTFPKDPLIQGLNQNRSTSTEIPVSGRAPAPAALPAPSNVPPPPAGFAIETKAPMATPEPPAGFVVEADQTKIAALIEAAGGKLKSITDMKNSLYENEPTVYVDFPTDKKDATFALRMSEVTPEAIAAKIAQNENVIKAPSPGSLSSTSAPVMSTGAQSIPQGPSGEPFKLHEEVKGLVDQFAKRIGERYVKPGSEGTYYLKSKTIRVQAMNNLFTSAHEIFHYISDTKKIMSKVMEPIGKSKVGNPIYNPKTLKIRQELNKIYFELYGGASPSAPLRVKMEEAGAMLFETYIKDPDFMRRKYPLAVKQFIDKGGEFYDPITADFVSQARVIYEKFLALDPLGKILARTTDKKFVSDRESFLSIRDRITTQFFDSLYMAEKMGKQAGTHMTTKDPQIWFRLSSMVRHLAHNNVTGKGFYAIDYGTGNLAKVSDRNWGDLINDLSEKKILDKFSGWLIARDQHFEYIRKDELRDEVLELRARLSELTEGTKEFIETKKLFTARLQSYREQAQYLRRQKWNRDDIDNAFKDYSSDFMQHAIEFDSYTKASLSMMKDAGMLTPQSYQIMADNPGYAPMKRQFYDDILGDTSARGGAIKVGGTKISSMMRRTGSENTIINPLYQAIVDMGEVMTKTMKQRSINSIGKIAESFPDMFHKLELIRSVDERTGKIFYPQDKDPNILMMRENGRRIPYLVDSPEVKAFIEEFMTPMQISWFEKIGNFTARMFTKGTTAMYPFFAANNFIQDQIFALGNTRTKMLPVLNAGKMLHQGLLKQDPEIANLWERYHLLGGQYVTRVHQIRELSPDEFFKEVTKEKNFIEHAAKLIDQGMNILSLPVQGSEVMTRFVEFARAVKGGDSEFVALEKAGRVSGPFHHKGKWGGRFVRGMVDQIPYFNASMQILGEQTDALMSKDPKRASRARFLALSMGALMVAALVNTYRNGTEKQRRLLRDLNPQEHSKYLFVPAPNGEDLIRVRIPDISGSAAAMINMGLIEYLDQESRYTPRDFVDAGTAFVPDQLNPTTGIRMLFSWLPQIIRPSIELATNTRTFPTPRPLESIGMQYREPKNRAYPTTSQMAKDLGAKLDLSPIKIDYLIQGYMGRVTKIPTWVYDTARGADSKTKFNPFVREWYFESSQILQDYYKKSQEANQKFNTVKNFSDQVTDDEAVKIREDHKRVLRIERMMDDYRASTKDLELIHEDKLTQEQQMIIEARRTAIIMEIEQFINPSGNENIK